MIESLICIVLIVFLLLCSIDAYKDVINDVIEIVNQIKGWW